METKAFTNAEIQVNVEKREVTAYAAVFNNIDRAQDRMWPGAFSQTLKSGHMSRGVCAYKYNHGMPDINGFLLGKALHAEEDTKGLLTVARVSRASTRHDEMLHMMADESLNTYSIYYKALKARTDFTDGVRNLREVALFEFGPVDPDIACNPEARVLSVKGVKFTASDCLDAIGEFVRELEAKGGLTDEDRRLVRELHEKIQDNNEGLKALMGDGTDIAPLLVSDPLQSAGPDASTDQSLSASTAAQESLSAIDEIGLKSVLASLKQESAALGLLRAVREMGKISIDQV